ncbi:hypothetical protein GYB22_08165 [bacterium]|nr:hypothetical protein [bacterium]
MIFAFLGSSYLDTTPSQKVNSRIVSQLSVVEQDLAAFLKALEEEKSPIEYYHNLRSSYKAVETYVVFRYPDIDKMINGGPVPSISTEVTVLHKDDPTGMQVIEELLVQEQVASEEIAKQLRFLKTRIEILKTAFSSSSIREWEILDANHMALTRLMTLSLTGFDSPELQCGLEDARIVLNYLKEDLNSFQSIFNQNPSLIKIEELAKSAETKLNSISSFGDLEQFSFFKNYLIPLQSEIKHFYTASGFELYNQVTTVPRSIYTGDHLFAKDYLDPLFSMRGNGNTQSSLQIELGKILFFDPILSIGNDRSCASCHKPELAFSDGEKKSIATGFNGTVDRNAPGLINSAYQSNFFWDLRSQNMNDQITNVIVAHKEFNTTADQVVKELNESDEYRDIFSQAFSSFDEPVSMSTIKTAIELYIRSLVALNSKFDQNIRGEAENYTKEEILGANIFFGKAQCATCHFPPMFNGFVPPHYRETEGEILGVESAPKSGELDPDGGMYERFKHAYPKADYIDGMFKTSGLRNIDLTAPYMHNGAYLTLREVVEFYNEGGGLGRGLDIPQQTLSGDSLGLTEPEIDAIIAFMKTLADTTGTHVQPFDLPSFGDARDERVWGGEY